MFKTLPHFEIKSEFELDTYAWFTGRRFGHMDRWGYLEPKTKSDIVRGAELWDKWEQQASLGDNMLKRQGQIIHDNIKEMAKLCDGCEALIDLGPGGKNAILKNTVPYIKNLGINLKLYTAIDVAKQSVEEAVRTIKDENNDLDVCAVQGNFFTARNNNSKNKKTVALMMGGTIGNFSAVPNTPSPIHLMSERLKRLRNTLPKETIIFIGLESTQNAQTLYDSYDHPIHEEFEINMMHAIKRDLLQNEAGFDPYAWKYSMQWYPDAHQFCHIAESTALQRFSMYGEDFRFAKGDQLVIDNSFKFPVLSMQRAAQLAGAEYLKPFSDSDGRMVIHAIRFS